MHLLSINNLQSKLILTLDELLALTIIVPDLQRSVNHDRVQLIIDYQKERFHSNHDFVFLGDLVVATTAGPTSSPSSTPPSYLLIDGHHRYSAIQQLYVLKPDYKISLLVVHTTSEFTVQDAFVLLNKNEPVPDYIINTTLELGKRTLLSTFEKMFLTEFKAFVKPSAKPRRPHINLTHVLDALASSDGAAFVERMESAKIMLGYMKWVNINKWKPMLDHKGRALCEKKGMLVTPLYMCADVDADWLTRTDWMEEFLRIMRPVAPPTSLLGLKKKTTIPKPVRDRVWQNAFDTSTEGFCACCAKTVTVFDFEAGHIVPEAKGGTTTEHNLRPICKTCNTSMGTMCMSEFARRFFGREL